MIPTEAHRAASADPDGAGSGPDDPRVLRAVEEYLAALEAGRAPGRDEFLGRHAAIAARLGDYLDGLELIHRAGPAAGPASDGGARRTACPGRSRWGTSCCCARSAGAAWGSSTRPCSALSAAGWR